MDSYVKNKELKRNIVDLKLQIWQSQERKDKTIIPHVPKEERNTVIIY